MIYPRDSGNESKRPRRQDLLKRPHVRDDQRDTTRRCQRVEVTLIRNFSLIGLLLILPTSAFALDYDRNEVVSRELAFGGMMAPFDVDPRPPVRCTYDKRLICESYDSKPVGFFIRGTARRHRRNFYVGAEMQLGLTLPLDSFGPHPWIGGGGAIGVETADNGWARVRGYSELGVGIYFSNSSITDMLNFFAEVGARYQLRVFDRPHFLLHLGIRGMTSFSEIGLQIAAGVGWTFD